ncbi:DUF4132 domain-containing protein [Actinacidiphila sp. bgisy160]|uniref:DUF4132 domain-containing protein n=1 Tax=Actinacidiphila sp. bgisy160 TaxID=3413796 RepID=UPI003D76213A
MLYDTVVAEARRNDAFDDVRSAALDRARWLVDLLDRGRAEFRLAFGPRKEEYRRFEELHAATRTEIDEGLATRAGEEARAAALSLLLVAHPDGSGVWHYRDRAASLISRQSGWTPDEVAVMLLRIVEYDTGHWLAEALTAVLNAVDRLDVDGRRAVNPLIRHAYSRLMAADVAADVRGPLGRRLRALLAKDDPASMPDELVPADAPWATALRERAGSAPTPELAGLVRHLASLSGPRPSQRWRRDCLALSDAASARGTTAEMLRALAEDAPMCSRSNGSPTSWHDGDFHLHYVVGQKDGDLARGAVWAAALTAGPDTVGHLTALALRAGGPGSDVIEDLKLAGAAINALAEIDDPAALEALWRLRAKLKHRALLKQLGTALATAAARQGITPGQLIERSVPGHGLGPDGSLVRELAGCRVRLAIEDAATVRLTFTGPDGRTSRTAPAAVKAQCADELAELKLLARQVRATLSAERARLEALMSAGRIWPYDEWRRHYRDHPVTGILTRGLIWEAQDAAGDWHAVAPMSRPPGTPSHIRLWHPVHAPAEAIATWRARVVADGLRQPFKQAFREIYLPTPAEEETGVYSNRFAAHIVDYPRLYALFKERGWQANFLGNHDGGYDGLARGEFGDGGWRACFHHEPADDNTGHAPDHAATDQVRFERRDGRRWREAPLAEVPPLVFSEAMRDVDLFVGVTSIAADPTWTDRGEDRYAEYWRTASFGELTANAEIRREALQRILPRLKIADRCSLGGRYLTVRGDLTTYRIHLGSANVLMAPDDAYLCIVPARRKADRKLFLPFEDERLALILSKAALLAADSAISDPTILRQIKRATR